MTTKWRMIGGVEQGSCKSGVRRLRLVRLRTDYARGQSGQSAVPEWAHSTVPKRGSGFKCPTCRAANGTVRRSSDPRRTVLIALLVRQQWQRRRPQVRRVRNKLEEALNTGQWLHCPAHGLRISAPAIGWQRWRGSSSSSSSDSELAECVNYQVKYQHECNNYGVKTLYRELCSSRARSCISPHTSAPLPLHCLCHSGRAAAMSCVQRTSIDRQWGCVLRCPGTSCCSAQLGATRTSGELLRQRNCITRGIAHGATKLQTRRGTRRSATESSLGS